MRSLAALAVMTFLTACGRTSGPEEIAQTLVTTTPAGQTTLATTTVRAPDERPGEFVERVMEYEFKGQFGRAWDLLHPGHQALVSRSRYEECTRDAFPSAELESVKTIEVYDDPLDVDGIPQRNSKAVTVRITVRTGLQRGSGTETFHAVLVDGRWAWILAPGNIDNFKAGECPPP